MSRRTVIGGSAFGASVLLLLALASVSLAGPGTRGSLGVVERLSATITVVERATTDVVIDLGEPDDSIGDTLAFGNGLFNAANTKRVGHDQGGCVRTNPGIAWECTWTNFLNAGHITVQGPFYDDGRDSWLSITGGTGLYANASGEMRLHWRNPEGTEFDFTFHVKY